MDSADLFGPQGTARRLVSLLAVSFFLVGGAVDVWRDPSDPRRAKEYAFLALSTLLAIAYGIAHDHATATISPGFFQDGKGLRADPRPFRLAVTILAARGTYWVGLALGTAMLVANNPRPGRPQLPYRELTRLCLRPLVAAALGAATGAILLSSAGSGQTEARFLAAWGSHAGSYVGGLAGGVAAVAGVLRRRTAATRRP